MKGILFLNLVGVFVFYQTYRGLRAIRNKSIRHNLPDGAIIFAAFVNGVVMIYTVNIVLAVFGGITMILMFTEIRAFIANRQNKELPRLTWLTKHIGRMIGSYIGTLTAFLIVNTLFEPGWIIWLAPAAVFDPLMQYWIWKYTKNRFANFRSQDEVPDSSISVPLARIRVLVIENAFRASRNTVFSEYIRARYDNDIQRNPQNIPRFFRVERT